MSKHTPGPWHVGEGPQAQIVYDKEGWGVANAVVFHRKHEQGSTLANARLISAAPELLAMLEEARRTLEMWKDVAPAVSLCTDIDKVIARAKGELQ